ncbi:MAG TPA: phage tail protein [Stellaceae bacterium]|jgi:hypothetical protein
MASVFGSSSKAQAQQQPAISGLQIQTSAYGKVIPLVYGTTRIAPNLIWYGDFLATPHSSGSSGGGGKGGVTGGGGGKGGGSSSTTYTYSAAVALGLCEGPIAGIGAVWASQSETSLAALGLGVYIGSYPQPPWNYLSSVHPDQALAYCGTAYAVAPGYQLDSSAQLPNHNFEIFGFFADTASFMPDADPSQVVGDLLTNPFYGAGFPAARLGSLATYQSYTLAAGLWISPAYTDQAQVAAMLEDIASYTNSEFVWSSGVLTMVPYGDAALAANGYAYTPPSAPLYDLGDDDFLPNTATGASSSSTDPVLVTRLRPADALNDVKIEYLDRNNQYNTSIVEASDQAMIDLYGLRSDQGKQAHLFADVNAARQSAQLMLQRQAIRNTYQFTLDQRYILLDPMDIVTLSDARLGLARQWVRITEITENDDGTLLFAAEDYLAGTGSAATYSFASGSGYAADYNADPGNALAPVLFEPTVELTQGGPELWLATAGGALWGGADIYVSSDGNTYKLAATTDGPARLGVLTAAFPAGADPDTVDTLAVDLSASRGQLLSGTQSDADLGNTLSWVDGELVAYETATLTGAYRYALGTYLRRGLYNGVITEHAAGASFVRLDNAIVRLPYDASRIGQRLYIKLVSFNLWGGGQQQIADVIAYSCTITGAGLAAPLPAVTGLSASYIAGLTQLAWQPVADPRSVDYELRQGQAPSGAAFVGRTPTTNFALQGGDGTYWLAAHAAPLPGLDVYSESWISIDIAGATLVRNVVATVDEAARGWNGTVSGGIAAVGGMVVTTGSGDIAALGDFLGTSDFLFEGSAASSGLYASAAIVDTGRPAPSYVALSYVAQGVPRSADDLGNTDFLATSDFLSFATTANIAVTPVLGWSDDTVAWTWQNFQPGQYAHRYFSFRFGLASSDDQTQAILSESAWTIDMPDRVDVYQEVAIPVAGLALSFQPTGAAAPAPFNGGPGGSPTGPGLPAVSVTWLNQAGDTLAISGLTRAGCTIAILNGGAGVARTAQTIVAQGY